MKTALQRVIYSTVLLIAVINNSSFAQAIVDDNAKLHITSMAVCGDNIFAGTRVNGVYRSVDGGQVWEPVNSGLPTKPYIIELASSEKKIFTVVFGRSPSMYVSADNGLNWSGVNVCPADCKVTGVSSFKNKVFASTANGMYESTDEGTNWKLVSALPEKEMSSVIANKEYAITWSYEVGHNKFYSSPDGKKWNEIRESDVNVDHLEVHGNNFVARWCQHNVNISGQSTCRAYRLWVLDKNAKKWEEIDFRARYFGFDENKIYAIKVEVVEKKKKAVYNKEIVMSDDKGKSWNTVDENTDPFVLSDYGMQEKLIELKAWESVEIDEINAVIRGKKLAEENYAAAMAEARKKLKAAEALYNAPASSGRPGSSTSDKPDYRALSQDRYNAKHNTRSYIDSRGGIHIR